MTDTHSRTQNESRSATRVKDVQAISAKCLRLSLAFSFLAAAAAVFYRRGAWLPLHLLFGGGLLLAISGATQLFAVTWSSAPAPRPVVSGLQRWSLCMGVIGAAIGHELSALRWSLYAGAAVTAMSMALLAGILITVVRGGSLRRFDSALRFYVVAIGFGIAGIGIAPFIPPEPSELRSIHAVLNLLGLVGLVIAGTLPFFMATEARVKMSVRATPRRQAALLAAFSVAVAAAVVSLEEGWREALAPALILYVLALIGLVRILPSVGRKQLSWAGPRLLLIGAGILWWIGTLLAAALAAPSGDPVLLGRQAAVLGVGGYLQILLGSLAYLGPVLRGGGHESLSAGFRITRSWEALCAANAAAVALVIGQSAVARAFIAVAVAGVAIRTAMLLVAHRSEGVRNS